MPDSAAQVRPPSVSFEAPLLKLTRTLRLADFVDQTDATGIAQVGTLKAGSIVIGAAIQVITGFVGDTTAVLDLGVNADATRFYTGAVVLAAKPLGVAWSAEGSIVDMFAEADIPVEALLTGAADFGDITAGLANVQILYIASV